MKTIVKVFTPIILWLIIYVSGNIYISGDAIELWFRFCGFLGILVFLPFVILGLKVNWVAIGISMWIALCIFGFICIQKFGDNVGNWFIGCGVLVVVAGIVFGKTESEQRIDEQVEAMRRFDKEKQEQKEAHK